MAGTQKSTRVIGLGFTHATKIDWSVRATTSKNRVVYIFCQRGSIHSRVRILALLYNVSIVVHHTKEVPLLSYVNSDVCFFSFSHLLFLVGKQQSCNDTSGLEAHESRSSVIPIHNEGLEAHEFSRGCSPYVVASTKIYRLSIFFGTHAQDTLYGIPGYTYPHRLTDYKFGVRRSGLRKSPHLMSRRR